MEERKDQILYMAVAIAAGALVTEIILAAALHIFGMVIL